MNHPLDRIPRWLRLTPAQWGLVIGLAVFAGLIGFVLQSAKEKTYSSTAKVLFRSSNLDQVINGAPNFSQDGEPASIQATNLQLIATLPVARRVAEFAKLPEKAASDLLARVSVGSSGNTNVADLTISDADPDQAAALANAWVEQFIIERRETSRETIGRAITQLQSQRDDIIAAGGDVPAALVEDISELRTAQTLQLQDAELLDQATPSDEPDQAAPRQVFLGVALLQGLLGLGVVAAYRRLRDPIDSSDDLASVHLPVLADLPRARRLTVARGAAAPENFESGLRLLLGNMKFVSTAPGGTVVGIQSTRPSEGKSSISFHLARVAARSGSSVCLVDADLRYRTITRGVGHPHGAGLSDLLASRSSAGAAELDALIDDALIYVEGFDLLGAGPPPPNPGELAVRDIVPEIVLALRDRYDLVIIDAPPFLGLPDAARFLQASDGVVVVVRRRAARLYQVRRLVERLKVLGATPMGIVLNMAAPRDEDLAYGYGEPVALSDGTEEPDEDRPDDPLDEFAELDDIDETENGSGASAAAQRAAARQRGGKGSARSRWRR